MGRDADRPALHWDLFCRVVDNHGDLGTCWRLARRLGRLGQAVRLWVDDAAALAWMAPHGDPAVAVLPWRDPLAGEAPGDVVVEAFGCDLPPAFVERMAAAARVPVWINLDYLSAEPYALRSHGLPSPQSAGAGAGLTKWFFYPGFTAASGGLLLEDELADALPAVNGAVDPDAVRGTEAWLAGLGVPPLPGAQRISLFCYEQPALAAAVADWTRTPTQLLVTPGHATRQVASLLGCGAEPGSRAQRGALHVHVLPWLAQPDYDRLLAACDLNLVRGEDSLARALWAARPFLWQLYVQHDGAHHAKLDAFLACYLAGAPQALASDIAARFRRWNGAADGAPAPVAHDAWRAHAAAWSARLRAQQRLHGDLARRLLCFAAGKR